MLELRYKKIQTVLFFSTSFSSSLPFCYFFNDEYEYSLSSKEYFVLFLIFFGYGIVLLRFEALVPLLQLLTMRDRVNKGLTIPGRGSSSGSSSGTSSGSYSGSCSGTWSGSGCGRSSSGSSTGRGGSATAAAAATAAARSVGSRGSG